MIARILMPVIAVLASLYITITILTTGGNALSEAMQYLAGAGIIVGLLNPRAGVIFALFCGNYLDFCKRFLVVSGSFTFADVITVLAVAPVAMAGVYAGVLFISSRTSGSPISKARLSIVMGLGLAVVAAGAKDGHSVTSILQTAANSAMYVGLIAFAGPIFRTAEDQHKLMRNAVLLFVPVVIYGVLQLWQGYNWIEVRYALSGMSVVLSPLQNPSTVEYKRIFSTMNSTVAYTMVGAVLSLYVIFFGIGKSLMARGLGWLFALACLASHIPGANRTGWAVVVLTFAGYFVFKRKAVTITAYTVAVLGIIVFLVNAEVIGEKLAIWFDKVGSSEFQRRAATMGTFTTRTQGIARVFSQSKYFSMFGLPKEIGLESGSHDMLGQIYVTTGAVGLATSVVVGGWMLIYLHRGILTMRQGRRKDLAAFYAANVAAIILAGIVSGSQLHVFPVNLYVWLMLGMLFQLIQQEQEERLAAQPKEPVETRPAFPSRMRILELARAK